MNFKTTYLLFGLLAVLLGVLAVVLYTGPTAQPGEGTLFPTLSAKANPVEAKDVDKIVIQRKKPSDADLVFERGDDNVWKITSPRALVADTSRVTGLFDNLKNAKFQADQTIPAAAIDGLKSPSRVVTVHAGERQWTLTVGDVTPGTGQSAVVYVKSSDRKNKTLSVKKSDVDSVLEDLGYFRNKELLGKGTDVKTIRITEGKKQPIELKKDKDRWRMVQPPYGDVSIDDLLNKVGDVSVHHKDDKDTDFVKDGVEKPAEYHLDPAKGPVLRIAVTRGEGDKTTTTTLLVGVGTKPPKEDKKYYAAVEEGKKLDVVKVSVDSIKPFLDAIEDPGKYRSKNLVQLDSFKQPDAIDVKNSYGVLEFRRPEPTKPWELYRDKSSSPVEEQEVRKLIDELNKKDAVTSFVDPKRRKELGLDKPDVEVIKVWADSLEKPDEKTKGKPAFKKGAEPATELRFGNREGGNVAVERIWGKESSIVLVPQTLLDQARRGPLAYLDKKLPPFNPGPSADQDVTKIELTRSGETIELVRPTEKDTWKFTKPARLKDRKASESVIRGILGDLNRLQAEEIVTEKPDTKELASTYDLAKPPVRVVITMTKDKKETTQEFSLGKEVGARGVYLKRGGSDTVYLVSPTVLNDLKKELRDTTLFSFDADKVTGLTLKGWHDVVPGAGLTLGLEQKDGSWTVKTPAGFNVDTNKVNELVRDLARLQADKFVPSGKGLTFKENALEIEITLPEKKVYRLTVGAPDGVNFFATSNQLEGETFVIPRGHFDEIKKGLGYFSKK